LHSGTVLPSPDNSTDAVLLGRACQTTTPADPEPPYDDRKGPIGLLASYFNAIERGEYARALAHWGVAACPSLSDLERRYADTASSLLAVGPPSPLEGAAGSQYTTVGTLLLAIDAIGTQRVFVGCYQIWRPSPDIEGSPAEGVWSLLDAAESAAPDDSTDVVQLVGACAAD
jgi:hypothetical protein